MERGTVTVAGVRSPVLRTGDPDASEAVVLVHGNPGSSEDWSDLVRAIEPFGRALALDMPGYGEADKPSNFDYTVQGYARHLGLVLDAERIERAHLVLHDFGGPWGLEWASQHFDRVASVTLINIGIMPGYRWHYLARIWRTPILGEVFMALTTRFGLGMALRHGNPRGLPGAYVDQMYANYTWATRKAILKLYRQTSDLEEMSKRLGAAFEQHKLPALVVWGARDPYLPVRFAEIQRQFFAVERVVRLEDSGHWPMIDNPAAVCDPVISFLRPRVGLLSRAA